MQLNSGAGVANLYEEKGDLLETSDFAAVLNREYKPGTDELYLTINVVKRRRIDASEAAYAKYTYLAHPFEHLNNLKLIPDANLDKVLSLRSLSSDIDSLGVNADRVNSVNRLQQATHKEFDESF